MATAQSEHNRDRLDERTKPPFLRRVRIRGYKSIGFCDVLLQPLTILVGRNGAGKSNFLDALGFLRDGMMFGVAEALGRRGGVSAILRRPMQLDDISIEMEVAFQAPPPLEVSAPSANSLWPYEIHYSLKIEATEHTFGDPVEYLLAKNPTTEWRDGLKARDYRITKTGDQDIPLGGLQPMIPLGQLFLNFLGSPPYVQMAERLRRMRFYNFRPEAMRGLQKPRSGTLLEKDGSNLASVIGSLERLDPACVQRLRDYLATIAEEVEHFEVVRYGDYETVRFRVHTGSANGPLNFDAASMSDGTLRALAALVAAFQAQLPTGPSVVGIEEPETALHPAAAQPLVAALREATQHTQILLTTHSADLLADKDLDPSALLVVRKRNGQTHLTPVDAASREIVRKELYTLADLQRMDQLDLDEADLARQAASRPLDAEA